MRVTSKGQVTIPIEIRAQLGFLPETEVEFAVMGDAAVLRRSEHPTRSPGRLLVERLRGSATVKMTTDEIMALTRGED